MSTKTITTCDVSPCTKVKGEGNHWLKFHDPEHGFNVVGSMGIIAQNAKDCCSQECLMYALSQWLEKQRNAERKTQKGEL